MKAFVNLPTENELTFNAEEYSDISGTNILITPFLKMLVLPVLIGVLVIWVVISGVCKFLQRCVLCLSSWVHTGWSSLVRVWCGTSHLRLQSWRYFSCVTTTFFFFNKVFRAKTHLQVKVFTYCVNFSSQCRNWWWKTWRCWPKWGRALTNQTTWRPSSRNSPVIKHKDTHSCYSFHMHSCSDGMMDLVL